MSIENVLINTLNVGVSPFHVAHETIRQLSCSGFIELDMNSDWDLYLGQGYYICPFGTTVIAFRVNSEFDKDDLLKISAAHLDSPCPRIKSYPEVKKGSYLSFNSEMYGGAINSTWLDRPLSIAGRVFTRSGRILSPKSNLVDFAKPVAVIPNLPIHMNRKVNEGVELNAQTDMQPILSLAGEAFNKNILNEALAAQLNVDPEDILSYELSFYNTQQATVVGLNDDFILSPRIDNISSVQACITGLTDSSRPDGIDLIAIFDHEEIGSSTKNGAGSQLLANVCERIYDALSLTRCDYLKAVSNALFLSLDVAHATHPNHPEKYDSTSGIALGEGIAFKTASKQNYSSDSEIHGIMRGLCEAYNIPYKYNFLRSDQPGGSTIGSIVAKSLPMRGADIGIPLLAMHSSCETMCIKDQENLEKFLTLFYSEL